MSDRSAEIEEGRGHLCAIPHERRGCAMCERDQLKARVQELEAFIRREAVAALCEDCPPSGYPTDKTRCNPCPFRAKAARK